MDPFGTVDGEQLGRNHTQDLDGDTVELVEAAPRPAPGETLKENEIVLECQGGLWRLGQRRGRLMLMTRLT